MGEALIVLSGNIGKEPECKYGVSGKAYAKFSIATTSGKDDAKKTTWHRCTCFGEQAEMLAEKCGKGSSVIVVGRLEANNWTDRDGNKHESNEVIVRDIGLSLTQRRGERNPDAMREDRRETGYREPPPVDEIPF